MKTKRILSTVLFMLALSTAVMAQLRVDITLKNKSIVSCPLEDTPRLITMVQKS